MIDDFHSFSSDPSALTQALFNHAPQSLVIIDFILEIAKKAIRQPLLLHVTIVASASRFIFLYCYDVPVDKAPEIICSKVAQLLKEQRHKKGLSLNALSQKAGLSRQSVSYLEQELRIPNLYTLLRITSVLEIDLEKIIARARKLAYAELKPPPQIHPHK